MPSAWRRRVLVGAGVARAPGVSAGWATACAVGGTGDDAPASPQGRVRRAYRPPGAVPIPHVPTSERPVARHLTGRAGSPPGDGSVGVGAPRAAVTAGGLTPQLDWS